MNLIPLCDLHEGDWDEAAKATLCDFIHMVANTPLKIKILGTFLQEPYLCIASDKLAQRLMENAADVRSSVLELREDCTLHYCSSFGYSDLCSLSFQHHPPAIQYCLSVLRLALRHDPQFVWAQIGRADPRPPRENLSV